MKQTTISLNNKEILLVELPEGAKDLHVLNSNQLFWRAEFMGFPNVSAYRDLPEGNWKLIGKLSDITEEQCHELVESFIYEDELSGTKENVYRDYIELGFYDIAKESFISKLTSEGVYTFNKYGEQPPDYISIPLSWDSESLESDILKWQQAQKKVWNINNTYLFIKL